MEKITIYGYDYLTKFKCVEGLCEESCCSAWKVDIDKETYKKYLKNFNADLKTRLEKNFRKYPFVLRKGYGYGKFNMDEKGNCPFFTDDKLCRIQKEHGLESLSLICYSYPRVNNVVDDKIERSLVLSCPEAVKLVLFTTKQHKYTCFFEEDDREVVNVYKIFHTKRYYKALRNATWDIIKDRRFPLWERLIILGDFYKKLNKVLNEGHRVVEGFIKVFIEDYMGAINSDIPTKIAGAGEEFRILNLRIVKKIFEDMEAKKDLLKAFSECYSMTLKGFDLLQKSNEQYLLIRMYEINEKIYNDYFKDKDYIFENYLINYMERELFPFNFKDKKLFEAYAVLVLHYSVLKFMIQGIFRFHGKSSDEAVIKLIYSFSKVFSHDKDFFKKLHSIVSVNDLTGPEQLVSFVREE